ncbi:hypothetical protein HIM_05201 [Hirsutella minnesotensis 3608]|uniref:Xylanolytic transcriptional activator regulatory domain-containing protein n=1 Tax=Hirsutella minnesotensis 3608 TaxID=1043627 RepID=A0A0F7ZPC8_9HYPO|nr:hypothetical protein HIM_05201 [Hirsutella minnesotensis 3608]
MPPDGNSSVPSALSNTGFDSGDEEPAFAGDLGLTAQTTFANNFLKKTVEKTSLRKNNPRMEAALLKLRGLVESHQQKSISHGPRFPLQTAVPPGGICKLPMPPISAVTTVLKTQMTLFNLYRSLICLSDFSKLYRQVYSVPEECSSSVFTIVNVLLHTLFTEQQGQSTDQMLREEYSHYIQQCRVNLETSLANVPSFLPGKVEDVQALMLGVFYAIETSRPLLSWQLNCNAAQLCQTAGYHRIETAREDPAAAKLKGSLFWTIFNVDASLSLRLRRAPAIHECDINIPCVIGLDAFGLEWSAISAFWIKIARLQRRIYQDLYSPAAQSTSQPQLIDRARMLAEDARSLQVESEECRTLLHSYLQAVNSSGIGDMILRGHEAQFHVTFALVFQYIPRAVPQVERSRFSEECLAAARQAMMVHRDCARLPDPGSYLRAVYIHWTFLLTPFSPFFVLFCYVLETLSIPDLQLLQEFVTSLEASRGFSESIHKLYLLTKTITEIAVLYVEARSEQAGHRNVVPNEDEFEIYLDRLRQSEDPSRTITTDVQWAPSSDIQFTDVFDWFFGNDEILNF